MFFLHMRNQSLLVVKSLVAFGTPEGMGVLVCTCLVTVKVALVLEPGNTVVCIGLIVLYRLTICRIYLDIYFIKVLLYTIVYVVNINVI